MHVLGGRHSAPYTPPAIFYCLSSNFHSPPAVSWLLLLAPRCLRTLLHLEAAEHSSGLLGRLAFLFPVAFLKNSGGE